MRTMKKLLLLAGSALLFTGCTMTREATFANFETGEVLTGVFKDSPATDGTCEITMPDGEVLKGKYSGVREHDTLSFGSAFATATATGPAGTAFGSASAFGSSRSVGGKGRAYALLTSTKPGSKLMMEVIAVYSVLGGHGWGEARTNDGRAYKVQF